MPRILIVDDSSLSRRILRRILEPVGYQITEAEDGLTAIEQYSLERPDVVLLDLTMNGMHGLDVLCKLCELDEEANVIVATADIQDSSRAMAEAGGAHAFLSKPFSQQQVLDVVASVLPGGVQ